MSESFFEKPILNSPYDYPAWWEVRVARQQYLGDEVMKVFRI